MPKISVIIPCYNMGQYVDEAVSSVLAQTFADFEIIIVNDGSTDEATVSLLQSYQRPRTRVVHTQNQGLPSARNNGIRQAAGEYIACLDADDKYDPQFLEKTVNVLDADSGNRCGFVTTWVQAFENSDFLWETSDYDVPALLENNVVHVASLFRRSVWEATGGYNTDKGLYGYEDWNFWIAIVGQGYQWHCLHEALFNYRVRSNSMLSASTQMRPELVRCICGHHPDLYRQYAREIIYLKEVRIQSLYREKARHESLIQQLNESKHTSREKEKPLRRDVFWPSPFTRIFRKLKVIASAG